MSYGELRRFDRFISKPIGNLYGATHNARKHQSFGHIEWESRSESQPPFKRERSRLLNVNVVIVLRGLRTFNNWSNINFFMMGSSSDAKKTLRRKPKKPASAAASKSDCLLSNLGANTNTMRTTTTAPLQSVRKTNGFSETPVASESMNTLVPLTDSVSMASCSQVTTICAIFWCCTNDQTAM